MSDLPHPMDQWRERCLLSSDGEALWNAYVAADGQVRDWLLEVIVRRHGHMLRNKRNDHE